MINHKENFNNYENDMEFEFVLSKEELRKIVLDNFEEGSLVYSYFNNMTTEIENLEINDFLNDLYDIDYDGYEKLASILYAFYEYNNTKNFPLTIN